MYCVELSRSISTPREYEPRQHLCDLSPYNHLQYFYQLCVAHFKSNVHALHTYVLDKVYSAMLSLATCEDHPDIQRTLNTIRRGGPKLQAIIHDHINTYSH